MVHIFAYAYLKIKPNQLSIGALHRKLMQYGFKLSTKHPSETNNSFENSDVKSIIFLVKNKFFHNIPIKIKIVCNTNDTGLKYFAYIRFGMFLVRIDTQK